MFDGNFTGNVIAILFYLLFQAAGIWMMNRILAKERFSIVFRLLIGSVAGTIALQWCPVLFAFIFNFTVTAHIMGLILWLVLCVGAVKLAGTSIPPKSNPYRHRTEWLRFIKENPCIWLMLAAFVFFAYCLLKHTIRIVDDGSMHCGQATYGDMNMHLGFITSIANQESFPPDYSLFPGIRLAYPFLCDSVSSSLYIWGASLRVAYIFPMLVAIWQVMGGFYCFIKYWFGRSRTALIAWILFFLDGGLGFVYFTNAESLSRNFTDFYYTPTSIGDMNFRWAQIIANMLIPQRATLFGWAVLFPLLALFLYAVRKHNRLCFIIAAVFASALPMIHTHSFLGFGLVCTMWLLFDCKRLCDEKTKDSPLLLSALPIGLLLFSILQKINEQNETVSKHGLAIMGLGVAILVLYIIYELIKVWTGKSRKILLTTWGLFLAIIIVLALPQLILWTFKQAGTDGFVRGHFNWSNTGDQYIWFYLKNIGITFALFVAGFFFAKKKDLQLASPLFLIWFIAELVVFQPNEYDNNKLLFVGFVFMCGLAAEFLANLFSGKAPILLKAAAAVLLLFFSTISALLTLGREWVSEYELYSASSVEACRFIEEEIETEAVLLTASNHNNAVVSLTGRNIVCGSGTFLYYHGIPYAEREAELPMMYADPIGTQDLYEKYGVDYVYISNNERGSYEINEEALEQIASCIYDEDDVRIYELNE